MDHLEMLRTFVAAADNQSFFRGRTKDARVTERG